MSTKCRLIQFNRHFLFLQTAVKIKTADFSKPPNLSRHIDQSYNLSCKFYIGCLLRDKSKIKNRKSQIDMSHPSGSNRRPTVYKTVALPAELGWP